MGCKASTDKKGEADYNEFAHENGDTTVKDIKLEIKSETQALSAETEDQLFEIYGVGVTVIAQVLLHIMRGDLDDAKTLVGHAGARQVQPGHDVRKRDVHPDMLKGVVELLGLQDQVADLQAKDTPQIEVEGAIRTATASWLLAHSEIPTPSSAQHLFERYTIERYFDDPEGLTELRVLEQVGLKGHNRHLTASPTPVYHRLHHSLSTRTLAALQQMRTNGCVISDSDKLNMDVLESTLNREIAYHGIWHKHDYAIDQMRGCHDGLLSLLTDLTPVNDVEDLANYMLRVNGISKKFKLTIAALKDAASEGIVPPSFALQAVAESCQTTHSALTNNPEQCALFTTAFSKLAASGFKFESDDEETTSRGYLLNSIEKAAKGYHSLNEEVSSLLQSHNNADLSVHDKAYYSWCLEEHSALSAQEIHHKGLHQVTMIESNINSCLERLRDNGKLPAAAHVENQPIAEYVRILAAEDRFQYPSTDEGKESLLTDYIKLIDDVQSRTAVMFHKDPDAELLVKAVDSANCAGAYYAPAAHDGSSVGTFFVNGANMAANPKFAMRTMVAHEAIPGHHLQISLALENSELPFFRRTSKTFTAYVEGWALYAERLAQEAGFFADDDEHSTGDFDYLGMLSDELLRATRLVVDTGIHHFDWTREQALDYMKNHTALGEADVVAELERYSVCPGQATCYMLGQLELLELRSLAMEHRGADFNLADFHQDLFSCGAMPLQDLRRAFTALCTAAPVVPEVQVPEVLQDAPVHVLVQDKVDVEREADRARMKAEADKLHDEYPDLHRALRENGLLGQNNDGQGYMDYVLQFVERGVTRAEQLKDVEHQVLVDIGLTVMEQRLFKKVFKMK